MKYLLTLKNVLYVICFHPSMKVEEMDNACVLQLFTEIFKNNLTADIHASLINYNLSSCSLIKLWVLGTFSSTFFIIIYNFSLPFCVLLKMQK